MTTIEAPGPGRDLVDPPGVRAGRPVLRRDRFEALGLLLGILGVLLVVAVSVGAAPPV